MSEMSKQFRQKFESIIDLRFVQVEGIIKRTSPDSSGDVSEMRTQLALNGEVRGFTFLGLYSEDGECDLLYGESVERYDYDEFMSMLDDEGRRVTSGVNHDGENILMLAVDAQYPMKNGETSKVLAGGLPMKYLDDALFLEEDDSTVYAQIIRGDGTFVVRSGEDYRENYFVRMQEQLLEFNGKTPKEYAQEMQSAMEKKENYAALVMSGETHQHLYCVSLPNTDWYLIVTMPYGSLEAAINTLALQRQYTVLASSSFVFLVLIIIFVLYGRLSQLQIRELEKAENEAARANKAKSEFLSSMSHDIRTPMNGIVGMTAIAMANINDSARVQDCLSKIELSSKHPLGLINDVLDIHFNILSERTNIVQAVSG